LTFFSDIQFVALFEELEQNVQQQKCSEFNFVQVRQRVQPLKLKAKGSVYYIPPAYYSAIYPRHIAPAYRTCISHQQNPSGILQRPYLKS
jgi:hypothetical protein